MRVICGPDPLLGLAVSRTPDAMAAKDASTNLGRIMDDKLTISVVKSAGGSTLYL